MNIDALLDDIYEICSIKGVKFRFSLYFCFEELILTYNPILNMANIEEKFRNELMAVIDSIMQGYNYFRVCDLTYWKDRYKHRSGVLRTRESLSSYICTEVTSRIKGNFKVTKNSIGSCWISDCIDTTLHENVCAMCKYPSKNCTFREKLKDLDENSVSRLSSPFSTIFDTE